MARCMTTIASRGLAAPAQVARIVAQVGTGTGLGGGLGDADGLASGDGLGVTSGLGLATSEGVGLVAAVPPPPHPVSANSKATATPSLNVGFNEDRAALVTTKGAHNNASRAGGRVAGYRGCE
jgi:hypothetical protein